MRYRNEKVQWMKELRYINADHIEMEGKRAEHEKPTDVSSGSGVCSSQFLLYVRSLRDLNYGDFSR